MTDIFFLTTSTNLRLKLARSPTVLIGSWWCSQGSNASMLRIPSGTKAEYQESYG